MRLTKLFQIISEFNTQINGGLTIMWLDKAIDDPIVAEIQMLQEAKCRIYDYNLIRECNRKIDLLVDKLCIKYMKGIVNKNTTD